MARPVSLCAVLLLAAATLLPAHALEIIHQAADVSASADGSYQAESLPSNSGGSLNVEQGNPVSGSDYAHATLSSSLNPHGVFLSVMADVDHIGNDGIASAEITLDFVVTEPLTFFVSRNAQATGSGYLGYVSYVRLSDAQGWIWEQNAAVGHDCHFSHPLANDLCFVGTGTMPAGAYTLKAVASAYYPSFCGPCHGYATLASNSVSLSFNAGSGVPIVLEVLPDMLQWNASPEAEAYDVVRGGLAPLLGSSGDYSVADVVCLDDDRESTSLPYGLDPPSGEGEWFLVRKTDVDWNGTYDSGGAGQLDSRNLEIDDAFNACP